MKKIGVCVCSNSGLDYVEYPRDIRILRSVIIFSEQEIFDDYTEMDAKTFYERIDQDPATIPKTAFISLGKIQEIFEEMVNEGYTDVIVITISSKLSGLYDAMCKLANDFESPLTIHPYDSMSLTYGEAYMALKAHELIANGALVHDIFTMLDQIKENHHLYFTVYTLKYLVLNGRLSKTSGLIGNFMQIKPLMGIKDGRVEPLEKIRTTKKAQARLLEKYFEETEGKQVITYISHAHNEEDTNTLKKIIQDRYPEREVVISYLTPVVGAHSGPRSLCLGYIVQP